MHPFEPAETAVRIAAGKYLGQKLFLLRLNLADALGHLADIPGLGEGQDVLA